MDSAARARVNPSGGRVGTGQTSPYEDPCTSTQQDSGVSRWGSRHQRKPPTPFFMRVSKPGHLYKS